MTQGPEFRVWRKHVLTRIAVFTALAIPVGLIFIASSPAVTVLVSGLGALGLIISLMELRALADSPAAPDAAHGRTPH